MLNLQNFLDTCAKNLLPYMKPHWEVDHACYRTDSLEHYEQTKRDFGRSSVLLIESQVGGRSIASYQLKTPKFARGHATDVVEIPAPKPGRKPDSGYEHVEVVIDEPFSELQARFPNLTWETKALTKSLNPELEASFESFNVKFHYHSLAHIINIEKNDRASSFLQHSQILSKLSHFKPLISGTIPLGIDTPNSDLDILFETADFDLFKAEVLKLFKDASFSQDQQHILAKTSHQGLEVELYASALSPLQQNAHRHLRIEGRLLKLLGQSFKDKVMALKVQGIKTEPAFGQLLGLEQPYQELLDLYFCTDLELLQRFS
tara:strand:+ start:9501 stop:10454 length:954 start_codon:yes stop_codon:yes gene_type:complete